MSSFHRFASYLRYWLDAIDEHSLHSPFFFDLYTNVIKKTPEPIEAYEQLRTKLLQDHREIEVLDLGAGSTRHAGSKRKVSDIARVSLSSPRFSTLYKRIITHVKAKNIVELGASLGINTLYLAHPAGTQVTTFEGAPTIADIAELTFEFAGAKNINLVRGDIGETLRDWVQLNRTKVDVAFIDANHRYEPTLRYFRLLAERSHKDSIFIIDDIHHSPEMELAWNAVKNHELVYVTADLFRCGLVFFDPSYVKQHAVLHFGN